MTVGTATGAPAREGPVRARFVGLALVLLWCRWLAGIAENFGPPHLSEGAALAMLVILALAMLPGMRASRRAAPVLGGLLAWALVAMLSLGANPDADPREAVQLLALLALYAAFANAVLASGWRQIDRVRCRQLVLAFVLAGAALAVYQRASGNAFFEPGRLLPRAIGSDVHPVSFAIQMVAALALAEVLRIRNGGGRGWTFRHLAVMALGALALYLTFARTAWVMAALVVLVALWTRASALRRAFLLALLPLLIAGLAFSGRFDDLQSIPRFVQSVLSNGIQFDYRFIDNSMSWRVVNWAMGLEQAMERPMLGFGPGQSAVASYFQLEMHNIFLETLFEGGFFGLIALVCTILGLVRLHRALPRRDGDERAVRAIANSFGLALLMAVTFSTSLVDQTMTITLYLLLLGAAGASIRPPTAGSP